MLSASDRLINEIGKGYFGNVILIIDGRSITLKPGFNNFAPSLSGEKATFKFGVSEAHRQAGISYPMRVIANLNRDYDGIRIEEKTDPRSISVTEYEVKKPRKID